MTDNDIIKALECCVARSGTACSKCPYHEQYYDKCTEKRNADIVDLINRQKLEIKNLDKQLLVKCECCVALDKAKTLERFAENIKFAICENTYPGFDKDGNPVNIWKSKTGYAAIDNLVKEMVGELNDT